MAWCPCVCLGKSDRRRLLMDAGVLFQGVVRREWGWVSFLEVGWGWGVGDGCMESVQFVSQVHGRCSLKLVLGTGRVCEIYHCHFRGILH